MKLVRGNGTRDIGHAAPPDEDIVPAHTAG
ncbi:hypothetical protein SAMN05421810_109194 [Amycolatopsis arida]|uniref:Uncharacterized protein n=1 Tax=Amycolatopsis arida TaxID=587909 RepID=A0A1I5ZGR5_9PSEU|nr:hypothetical protein CLV69_109193 [Amycolatopsis arida]SFQ55709.1 hypothetical protein SAMN05421810_109194 [Amycolatopsis arida]